MDLDWNGPRYRPTGAGHVESWFLKANHPTERRAIWLKATVLEPLEGPTVAEAWCVVFGPGSARGWRETVPVTQGTFASGDPLGIQVGDCSFSLGLDGGHAAGRLGGARWELRWSGPRDPLLLFPLQSMVDGAFPRSKTLTPAPSARFSGEVEVDGEVVLVDGWLGAQGHNWGRSHPLEHAWAQCVFADGSATFEGITARILVGGRPSPRISLAVLRHGGRTWRFDRVVDLWRQRATVGDLSWDLVMRSRRARLEVSLSASEEEVAALGYRNPDGAVSTCLNSKLARARVRLAPRGEHPIELTSEHGAALELVSQRPDPRFTDLI